MRFGIFHDVASHNMLHDFAAYAGKRDGTVVLSNILLSFLVQLLAKIFIDSDFAIIIYIPQ